MMASSQQVLSNLISGQPAGSMAGVWSYTVVLQPQGVSETLESLYFFNHPNSYPQRVCVSISRSGVGLKKLHFLKQNPI